jgi:mRNA-degrading endonuclease RelE of RelBE toxin-antitoxin system
VYTIKFASVVKSDVRKLDKQLQRIIKEEHLTSIEKDPFKAVPLLYEFKGLWSCHFNYEGTQQTQ